MFQHTAQRTYLNQWKIGNSLYRIRKDDPNQIKGFQSSTTMEGFGAVDWQTHDMERVAFADVERDFGRLKLAQLDLRTCRLKAVRMLIRWLSLHMVRNRKFRDGALANGRDYTQAVDLFHHKLVGDGQSKLYFAIFTTPVFITGDNPVVIQSNGDVEWVVAPMSPYRSVGISPSGDLGSMCLNPDTVNRLILENATEYCLSFDTTLRLPERLQGAA